VFRRSDRRDSAPDQAALAARDAATQGFLALDNEQRAAADAVAAAEEMGTARRLGRAWAEIAAVGDAATTAYLTATQEFPIVDGRGAPGGRAADERALHEIERAREVIRRFRSEHSRVLDEAEFALNSLPRTVQEARTALVSARAAVQQADASGVRSRRAAERLAEAEQAAVELNDTSVGLRQVRATAQRTLELARSAQTLAEEAPRTAQTVRTALASIATRRAAAVTKAERIPPAMSALRREFSEPCSRDLVDAERDTTAAITVADRAIAEAGRLAGAGDWDAAADQVTAARSALSRAEHEHDAVTDRLAELREIRADPAKLAADTRFVLRDAQRLVVDRGVTKRFGPILDAQSVRLQNAQDRLTGTHPDYWLYLTELRGVRDRVKDVVADARQTPRDR
jgi:DNA repair exonuclease SbcCD ATPase subunit